ncbi:helix-turn-helix transcriptional regulator [Streptomyces sp. NPDC050610]|uniref:helix-turn-helix domain-containing protein n=1 Tax=Streptomyces sp. NPDC050610 TaxID=3157097 RepID=UPI00342985D2
MTGPIESATPALCRFILGSELRRLRIESAMTAAAVAKRFHWGASKVNRLETAANGRVPVLDVRVLCQLYGASAETTAMLEGYAQVTTSNRDWWQSEEYRPVIKPGFKAFLTVESTAQSTHTYESEFVPGLLQNEAYVRAIHQRGHTGLDEETIDKLVAVRVMRQEALQRTLAPLKLTAVINEAVLRRRVGGPRVMRDQLLHMIELAALSNIKLQVVPFSIGVHPGMNGPFATFRFRDSAFKPIVYVENLASAGISRREDDVEKYEEAFSDLQAVAPGPEESLKMIEQASKEL